MSCLCLERSERNDKNYGSRIYYCDHEERIDEIGKLSVGELPKGSPEWCPLRGNADSDLIKIESDIHLKDKEGKPIEIKSIQPECLDRV